MSKRRGAGWIMAALGLGTVVAVLALAFWPVSFTRLSPPSAVSLPTPGLQAPLAKVPPMTDPAQAQHLARWAAAPEAIRTLAERIAAGQLPPKERLQTLGPEALSRGYPAPELDFIRNDQPVAYMATLLQEAVLADNLQALEALLAAGADPDVNHGEVLFLAMAHRSADAPALAAFPDFDRGLAFLAACFAAGANPNTRRYGIDEDTLLGFALGERNLGGLLMALRAGADPWVRIPYPDGSERESVIEELAFGAAAGTSSEVLFRLARSGDLRPGPAPQIDQVFAALSEVVSDFATGTGPEARHTAWRLDMLLRVLGPALGRRDAAEALRKGLTRFEAQADGGWYLAETEQHSPPDAPLSLPEKGDRIWGP